MKRRNKDTKKLSNILELLIPEVPLPSKYKNHRLKGNFHDCWECHIEPDWLLIYKKLSKTLLLIKTGTHADLF
ncbi:MAG: type II toxin-antitoxin system YafQ family toxin [Simkaniaceae bacterium]|nr:type II toxin-antitoxin system YafQ family toxin [Simkaniaceae bacterium]